MFQFDVATRNAVADAAETAIGTAPTLELRTGTPPANTAAADAGVAAGSGVLPADWLGNASSGAKPLAGTWQITNAAGAPGRVTHFRLKSGGVTRIQGLLSEAWTPSRAYAVGDQVHNGGNLYRASAGGTAAAAGGPTGTGASIADGGVTWAFVQAGTDMTIDNALISAGQTVNISAFSLTVGGA